MCLTPDLAITHGYQCDDRRSQTPFLAAWIPFDESPAVLPAPYPLARLRIKKQVVVVNQNVARLALHAGRGANRRETQSRESSAVMRSSVRRPIRLMAGLVAT